MDLDTAVRILSGVLFVVAIVVGPLLYWFFGRDAAEQVPNKARQKDAREEPERQRGEQDPPAEHGD